MLWQRLFFGILMIAAIVGLVLLDARLSANALEADTIAVTANPARVLLCALPMTLLMVLLVIPATYELARLCQASGHRPAAHWSAFVSVGLVIIPWIEMLQRIGSVQPLIRLSDANASITLFWLMGGVVGTCLVVLSRKKTDGAIAGMATTLLLILYLGLLSSFVVRIRCLSPGPAGSALLVYFILTVKSSDIGAYFTGRTIGKHKLAPWLSPGKTIEGFFGALVLASAVAVGGMMLWPSLGFEATPPPLQLSQALVFGALMAITGHIGDLVESAFKRDAGSKDSGRLLPGFGGLLDLIDSPVFTAPIAWLLLTFWG